MLIFVSLAFVQLAFATKSETIVRSVPRLVHKYSGPGCNAASLTDTWTIISSSVSDLIQCTVAAHTTPGSSSNPVHDIPDISLAKRSKANLSLVQQQHTNAMETLHLVCDAGTARFGAYVYNNSAVPSCSTSRLNHAFEPAQHVEFIAGRCANTAEGDSLEVDVTNLVLPSCVSASGDPHLTNLRGQKFDIHDGLHRFVHYPRGAPEDQALLMIDAQAVDVGTEADCYSVFLQNIKLSGKWVGDDITLNTNTSAVSSADPSAFSMSFALQQMDWSTLSKQHKGHLELKGSVPVSVDASMQQDSGEGKKLVVGGEEISVKVGDRNPVLVQVWSSYVGKWMTSKKDFRFLNLNVKNLPKDAGGILGLDSYSKPSSSRCGLVQTERDLANYIGEDLSLLRLRTSKMPQWTASAIEQH